MTLDIVFRVIMTLWDFVLVVGGCLAVGLVIGFVIALVKR